MRALRLSRMSHATGPFPCNFTVGDPQMGIVGHEAAFLRLVDKLSNGTKVRPINSPMYSRRHTIVRGYGIVTCPRSCDT